MTPQSNGVSEKVATGLGWFSIGLGVAEIAMPREIQRLIGVKDREDRRNLLRTFGMREIAAGIGILTARERPAGWMWARVAGDALDLATLGAAMTDRRTKKTRAAIATAAVAGVTALDVVCSQQLARASGAAQSLPRAVWTILINRSPEEVYQFWKDLRNIPRFMRYIESVEVRDERRSHWRAGLPGGASVEWDAVLTEDRPNRLIAWRSLEGSDVHLSGTVRFDPAPGNRGTMLRVDMQYAPPGGRISQRIAKLLRMGPEIQLKRDLRALKQLIETGEVARSEASIFAGMHAARPPERVPEEVLAAR
jgi:uncharacterized membrane protein